MKVMVTGGTGMAGSHTVRAFLEAGHAVRLLVRDPDKVKRVFGPELAVEDVFVGDVADAASVERAMEGCDAVFHAAAVVDLKKSLAQKVIQTNAAINYFYEATFPAAAYNQTTIIGDAMTAAALTHMLSGQRGGYPPLGPAAAWAPR